MKFIRLIIGTMSLISIASAGNDPKGVIDMPVERSRWSLGASASFLGGVDAEFKDFGGWNSPNAVPPALAGTNRNYDNGFNGVDGTGNAGGLTWNWGYQSPAQYDPATGSISMSIYQGASSGGRGADSDDWHPGLEVFAYYDMGELAGLAPRGVSARWGWKLAAAWRHLGMESSRSSWSDVTYVTDAFSVAPGLIPPTAPYTGSITGPGPLISDSGTRTTGTITNGALISGKRELDIELFGFDAGPYVEFQITRRFHFKGEAGVSLAIANAEYSHHSTTSIVGSGASTQSSGGRHSDWSLLPGFFVGATAEYQLGEQWSLYGNLRYQFLDDLEISAASSKATVDFSSGLVVGLGALYHF